MSVALAAQTPLPLRTGAAVILPPRQGWLSPTYGMVTRVLSPHKVQVVVTADSGGRRKGTRHDMPSTRVQSRERGQHRKPSRTRFWRHA
ncbi:hypothetical protein ACIO1C_29810 [Streptomyces sp. NPDC087420]|uniref:hypothetical protein n=1 Tax=Streptomyces sp. NPDC087420 TaxID=3365785 RepID=UPI0038373FBE